MKTYQRLFAYAVVLITLTIIVVFPAHAADPDAHLKALFAPLPARAESKDNPLLPARVALGKKLFSDTRLSLAQDLSCNSCHNLATHGVDNQQFSKGHKGQLGGRNSPSVYNAALHFVQFWDGRAKDVEEQALGPVQNPVEMAMPSGGQEVITRLSADPAIVKEFRSAFPGEAQPLTFTNIGKAIGAFERTLITPSRFDNFLRGDKKALSAAERAGLESFVQTGCVACHSGATVGGQSFQKLGLVQAYPTKDLGRYEVTKNEGDKFLFKVPSLRNVEKTGPYFHDGSVKTLEEAVTLMARHQLGRELSSEQVASIVSFLKTLTADLSRPRGPVG